MHPSYINSNNFCYYNHEDPNLKPANMQSAMETCSYNTGKLPASYGVDSFNSSLTGGKRSSKKDRHSKINTARGPRDRRMRLSLDVAKKFFSLQDMLGFDKASNTIEWLLMKSKAAVRDLMSQRMNQSCSLQIMGHVSSNSPSSASECEVVSGIDDKTGEENLTVKLNSCSSNKEKIKVQRVIRKTAYVDHSLAKETREKARARARKRTSEKRNIKLGYDGVGSKLKPTNLDQLMDQNTNRFGSWIPFGENQVQLTDQAEYVSSHLQFKQGIVGDSSLMLASNWSPSFLFNYQHGPGLSHEHQFGNLQMLGKPWEGINN